MCEPCSLSADTMTCASEDTDSEKELCSTIGETSSCSSEISDISFVSNLDHAADVFPRPEVVADAHQAMASVPQTVAEPDTFATSPRIGSVLQHGRDLTECPEPDNTVLFVDARQLMELVPANVLHEELLEQVAAMPWHISNPSPKPHHLVLSAQRPCRVLPSATLRPPPGLPAPAALPSHGSALHGSGQCQPCVSQWTSRGCPDGRACVHCHLCPPHACQSRSEPAKVGLTEQLLSQDLAGERFATKVADTHRIGAFQPIVPRREEAGHIALREMHTEVPLKQVQSVKLQEKPQNSGSELHALGTCEPCAWFWKPQGCRNANDCSRCHICPAGEIRARKKAKLFKLRVASKAMAD